MTVSPPRLAWAPPYPRPSLTFTHKTAGHKYITDRHTALLAALWGDGRDREQRMVHSGSVEVAGTIKPL